MLCVDGLTILLFLQFIMPPSQQCKRDGVEDEEFEAQVHIYDLPVASHRHSSLPIARHEASQEMLSFLADVITRKANYRAPQPSPPLQPPPPSQQPPPPQQPTPTQARPPAHHYGDASWNRGYQDERPPARRDEGPAYHPYADNQGMDPNRYYADREFESREAEEARNSLHRKRRYEPSREGWVDEPSMSRRRTEESSGSSSQYSVPDDNPSQWNGDAQQHNGNASKAEDSAPVFFVDSAGEKKPHPDRTRKALTMEERIKAEVDGYQELVAQMFTNRDRVMEKLDSIVWDASRETEVIVFDDKLSVSSGAAAAVRSLVRVVGPKLIVRAALRMVSC